MGYISIVGAAVPTEKLNKWLEEQNDPEITEFINDLRTGEQIVELPEDTGKVSMTYLYSDYIKWYESDPVIDNFMEFMSNLDAREYGFIRSGENYEDLEIEGVPYMFDVFFSRNIKIPDFQNESQAAANEEK